MEGTAMATRRQWRTLLAAACMAAAMVSGAARAQEVPLATGEHWTKSPIEVKKGYLVGMANIVHIELAYQGANPSPDAQSVLPRLVKGLKGHSLDSVREALDKWYAANPDKLQRPVVETLWFEIVVPGLKKAG
jgi:hypothetical protein